MAASYFNYKVRQFLVESYDGKNVRDLTTSVVSIQYFEDLFSPAIFIQLQLVNTEGTLTSLPNDNDSSMKPGIKGGERVFLVIEQEGTGKRLVCDDRQNQYFIHKITASTTQATKETLILDLAPLEVFANETSRVFKRYPKSESGKQRIDVSVRQILKDVLKTNKPINTDQTLNSYSFYGNSKKPFTVLTWLCPKAIPTVGSSGATAGTAGFLFYQNTKGYNFRSLDSLISALSQTSESNSNIPVYRYYEGVDDGSRDATNFKILSMPVFERNVNIFENMRIGMYSSVNYFFDANTRELSVHEYKLSDSYNIMKHSSGSKEKPMIPNQLQNSPSRLMVKTIDHLVTERLDSTSSTGIDNKEKYQSQSVSRYNLSFSQMLNITVPLNLNLTVGDVINLEFVKITTGVKEKDRYKSGYYLIKELSHLFSSNQGFTGLKLIRDSYGDPL